MNLPSEYVIKPSHPTAMTNPPMVSYPMLEKAAPWQPDLWIEVNAGLVALGKPTNAPLAMVLTDPHVLTDFYREQRSRADFIFNMQTPYSQPGDIHLPYAYSPRWHTPTEIPFEKRKYDAALLGLAYGNRNDLIGKLVARNLQVFYRLGPAYDDAKRVYHDTRVGLNWSSLQDTNCRAFELMALGLPAVMNKTPDLMQLFREGQDFVGFDNMDQALSAVDGLLSHPSMAQQIGENARRAVEKHTWRARIQTIFERTGVV
jgi:spore maturation protein CgeB